MNKEFIIICLTPKNNKLVKSKNGWAIFYPAINEYLWKFFKTEEKAKEELKKIDKIENYIFSISTYERFSI